MRGREWDEQYEGRNRWERCEGRERGVEAARRGIVEVGDAI